MRTPRLYRVFPWVAGARRGSAGHPLYTPPVQGAGRVDNPGSYRTLYASDSPVGAVAEAFGNHAVWTAQLLRGRPDIPGSVRAIAELDAQPAEVVDLDDAHELVRRGLRPSAVVTRDREITQRWALSIFEEKRFAGVRWWSYYDPRWGSYGIWESQAIRNLEVTPLTPDHPALHEAARILARPWAVVP
jgi:hypothetical protein